jgi:hypothetical protein
MTRSGTSIAALAVGCGAMLAMGEAHAGLCKLVVNVDLTASMNALRSTGNTKCFDSQRVAMLTMEAFRFGKDVDITLPMGAIVDSPLYDANCPTQPERVMDVRVFHGDVMMTVTDGFQPVETAYERALASNLIVWSSTLLPTDSCPGSATPMAQAMCRAAFAFSAAPTLPPAGEIRVAKTTTDGQDNRSDDVPLFGGELRCRAPGESEVVWRDRVKLEYDRRDIRSDAVLWAVGGATIPDGFRHGLTGKLLKQEPPADEERDAGPARIGDIGPAISDELGAADDASFFAELAAQVPGGRYLFVAHTRVLSSMVTLVDTDRDGVPDFRDSCAGACANDADADQIPAPADVCPTAPEDGRGALKADGCPDADSDGVRNGLDACPTVPEDGRPPFRADGCRAAPFAASFQPGLAIPDNGQACTSLTMTPRSDSALAKLDVSGTHTWRASLSGTISHNGVTVAAFPVGTFPTGSGNFSFTARPVSGLSGDTQGTWTLCLRDNDAFGDSGVLSFWSVHN